MKRAAIVCGMGMGDEGKGLMTAFLCEQRRADLVVRFSGGPQAAHSVISPSGIQHTFASFGAGTFSGAGTHLSRFCLVSPGAILREAQALAGKGFPSALNDLTIAPRCIVLTPWHRLANQIREIARGDSRHGSVGLGIGEARQDHIDDGAWIMAIEAIASRSCLIERLKSLAERKIEEIRPIANSNPGCAGRLADMEQQAVHCEEFADLMQTVFTRDRMLADSWALHRADSVVFEGSQGVLIDEKYGFAPYNTYTDVTFGKALQLIREAGAVPVERVGVIRSYFTRHGAGPFPSEDLIGEIDAPESFNKHHDFMGGFRVGHFDAEMVRYAMDCVGGIDSLAITHCDTAPSLKIAHGYGPIQGMSTEQLMRVRPKYRYVPDAVEGIQEILDMRATYRSYGPKATDVWLNSQV